MRAAVAIGQRPTWRDALAEATSQMPLVPGGETIDLAFLFASSDYAEEFPELVASARLIIGCSSRGVIGTGREVEGQPALGLLLEVIGDDREQSPHAFGGIPRLG